MPIYEYQSEHPDDREKSCFVCSRGFELNRPLNREALEKCPTCGRPVRKLVSRVNAKKVARDCSDAEATAAGFHVFNKNCDGGYDKVR